MVNIFVLRNCAAMAVGVVNILCSCYKLGFKLSLKTEVNLSYGLKLDFGVQFRLCLKPSLKLGLSGKIVT